jgi:hypothetical protein
MSYSSNGNRPKLSEKGLLTPDNCVDGPEPAASCATGSSTPPPRI